MSRPHIRYAFDSFTSSTGHNFRPRVALLLQRVVLLFFRKDNDGGPWLLLLHKCPVKKLEFLF